MDSETRKQSVGKSVAGWLMISCLFSVVLLVIRIVMTGRAGFIFLPWNLFLAWIPYFITCRLLRNNKWIQQPATFTWVFAVWMLFVPNSFYIITDLLHLQILVHTPKWFDLLLIFSFAWNGLILGVVSMHDMERIVMKRFSLKKDFVFILPVMWMIAVGIYIGRFMRFNSWDVITDPFSLVSDVGWLFLHPFQNLYEWGMIGCFFVFLTLIYLSLKKLSLNKLGE